MDFDPEAILIKDLKADWRAITRKNETEAVPNFWYTVTQPGRPGRMAAVGLTRHQLLEAVQKYGQAVKNSAKGGVFRPAWTAWKFTSTGRGVSWKQLGLRQAEVRGWVDVYVLEQFKAVSADQEAAFELVELMYGYPRTLSHCLDQVEADRVQDYLVAMLNNAYKTIEAAPTAPNSVRLVRRLERYTAHLIDDLEGDPRRPAAVTNIYERLDFTFKQVHAYLTIR